MRQECGSPRRSGSSASQSARRAGGRPAHPSPSPSASDESSASGGPTANAEASVSVSPFQGAWEDVTAEAIGETADWSNKVELADINGDGAVDLLFANGGDYETPGTPVASTVFLNNGDGTFRDATAEVFGDLVGLTRVIKARVHDNRTPNMPHDWQAVEIRFANGGIVPMTWYGENLFRAVHDVPSDAGDGQVCAVDAAGNEACL